MSVNAVNRHFNYIMHT